MFVIQRKRMSINRVTWRPLSTRLLQNSFIHFNRSLKNLILSERVIGRCCLQLHEKWNVFHWTVVYLVNWMQVLLFRFFLIFLKKKSWTTNHLYSIMVYHVIRRCELLFSIEMNFVRSNYFEIRVHWVYFVILKHSLTNTYRVYQECLYMYCIKLWF
jgi:hypothetical protein